MAKDDQAADEVAEKEQEGVENESSDETQDVADQSIDDADEETTDDAEEAPDESEDFERRFTQFEGETLEEYTRNLEKAYANSSTEALNLKKRADEAARLIATDPAAADRIVDAQGTQRTEAVEQPRTPGEAYATTIMKRDQEREWNEFMDEHPELLNDPARQDQLVSELESFAAVTMQKEGRMIGMKEGLTKAYVSLGFNDNSEEEARMAAKENAGQSKTSSQKKTVSKNDFTENQISAAMKLNPGKSRQEVIELLTKYAK